MSRCGAQVPETLAERLTATAWWRGCVAQASLPLVVLAVLTVEEPCLGSTARHRPC